MKKICYFDCFAGASGDMLLAALIGAGIDKNWFISELSKLTLIKDHFEIKFSKVVKKGIAAQNINIILKHHEHHHRNLNDIKKIINSSDIDEKAKELAIKIFTLLGLAEAKVHGTTIEEIHFHEVGAIDSIVDIVGFAILFTKLEIDEVYVSPINTGSGFTEAAHGILPVPAPATLEILTNSQWPIKNKPTINSELLTPTGAAILATVKTDFSEFPSFSKMNCVSYGAGDKDFDEICNVIRLTIGEIELKSLNSEKVILLETNIDDMSPEYYNFIFEKLFNAGCHEVFLNPIIMKKNRPANILSVICPLEIKSVVENIIFEETTTFGIRCTELSRTILNREFKQIEIERLGKLTIKIGYNSSGKIVSTKPEYSECERIAREKNIPIKKIYEMVNTHLVMAKF